MRIIHFSDTHLGFHDLDVLNADGINQREVDFYDAFRQVVDQALDIRPDYVIHTGDMFHRPHPTNRAIAQCLLQLKRLSDEKIPLVMIAGNHSMPRTSMTSPIMDALRSLDHVYPVFQDRYEKIEFDHICFHALPHSNDEQLALEEIDTLYDNQEKLIGTDKPNVLMMHCSVGASYLMEEYGERVFPVEKSDLFEKMDYVALGHWHGFGKIGKKGQVYYAGSTERTSSSDKRMDKGFAIVEIDDEGTQVSHHAIQLRSWVEICIETSGIEGKAAVIEKLHEAISTVDHFDDKAEPMVEVTLQNLTTSLSIDISNRDISDCFENVLTVLVKREFDKKNTESLHDGIEAVSLQEYFLDQIKEDSQSDKEFIRLSEKVNALFQQYEEDHSDSE